MQTVITASIVDTSNPDIQQDIWRILLRVDHEFVPPLSTRGSTMAMHLDTGALKLTNQLDPYFKELLQQIVVMAKVNNAFVGLMAFKSQFEIELLPKFSPCNYITTVGVDPKYRGIGVGVAMYNFILNSIPAHFESQYWVTRTWSSNDSHLRLLNGFGFHLIKTLENHRCTGTHTIYYARKYEPKPSV